MATEEGSVERYYARGLLEIRSTLHLALRLAVRLNQALQPSGAASGGTGLWRAVLPAFVLLDVAVWLRLRHSDHFGLAWRLPLDGLDAAFWTLSPLPPSGNYDWAVLIAIPLAVEAGVRLGWRALLLPVVLALPTTFAAVVAGKPVQLTWSAWIVLSVGMGVAYIRYCRHQDRRAELERHRVLAAARRRAYLAGQNRVAMGASSAVDAIEGLVPVLGRPETGTAFWHLADGWKSRLSRSTSEDARYLQVVLLEWEHRQNSHPDLSGLVQLHLEEGLGTTLVTAGQVRRLHRALDGLDLRGPAVVRLRDAHGFRLPGEPLRLDLDGRLVQVPADRRAAPPPVDPCAVTYVYIGFLTLAGVFRNGGAVPLPASALGLVACAGAGVLSHRRIVVHGERARPSVFMLAAAAAVLLTVVSALARSPITTDGQLLLPSVNGTLLLSFLGGFYWDSLAGWRWLVILAMVGGTLFGVAVFPVRAALTPGSLTAAVAWSVFPYFPCRHLARSLRRAQVRHAESVQVADQGAERAAFIAGRRSVVTLVHQARADALRQLTALQPELDPSVAELAADRLEEVGRRLLEIDSEPESSSSTTTA